MVEFSYYFTQLWRREERVVGVGKQSFIYSPSLCFPPYFFLLHSWIRIMFQRGRDGFIHIRLCVGAVFGESFGYYRRGSCTRG